jgi:AraC-like DNA-binding protein/HAMP domain-containing protein
MKIKQSLAYQLLKVTFSIYLVITVSITLIHMYTVWIQAEKHLKADLMKLGDSAQEGISLALWDINYVQVDLIVEGLLKLPIVSGIEVKDRKMNKLHGVRGDIEKRYQLIHEEEQGVTYNIGNMTIYSDSGIVFNRVKNGYFLTVINAIIKTLALWIIVLLAGKKLITKPLTLLTEANQSVDLENVETFKEVNIGIGQNENELSILEGSFNKMVQRLAVDRQELELINQNLEFKVEERTHELQKTNDTLKIKNIELRKALDEVKQLRGFLPICTSCKNVRDDQGYWENIEIYISNHSDAICTDSLCPDCEARAGNKYANINLADERRIEYVKKLEDFMLQDQAFLNEDISVQQVSEELNIPPHHLSMTINIEFEESFFNYVNRHRIGHAEKLLKDPEEIEESILMIAYRSGFQSKTSFNKAFKSLTGKTPSEYRKVHAS